MKKVLLTTTALAFAGSAFAADVSGYTTQGYSKSGENKKLWTEGEVYVSGSKTASNGLTFGATYTIGHWGQSSVYGASGKTTDATGTTANAKFDTGNTNYSNINGFVSSSFGRVDMGYHNAASRTHGARSTSVAEGVASGGYANTGMTGRIKNTDGVTYSTPSFNGISAAYSMTPAKNSATSWGVKYSGNMAGVGVAVAYGTNKPAKSATVTAPTNNNSWGVKVSKGAFAASYGSGKVKAANVDGQSVDTKQTRIGVAYSAGKIGVGYSQMKAKTGATSKKNTTMYAKYSVASGLTAYAQQTKAGSTKTTMIGTTISF